MNPAKLKVISNKWRLQIGSTQVQSGSKNGTMKKEIRTSKLLQTSSATIVEAKDIMPENVRRRHNLEHLVAKVAKEARLVAKVAKAAKEEEEEKPVLYL